MIPRFKIEVTQGQIHINSVTVNLATSEIIHLLADTKAKYPVSEGFMIGDGVYELMLGANDDTLYVEPSSETTIVRIKVRRSWVPFVETGRYTVGIVLVKENVYRQKKLQALDWYDDARTK
jgi:hypothetical protein